MKLKYFNFLSQDDQHAATEEKSALEEAQRNEAKERKAKGYEWVPKYFELVSLRLSLVATHVLFSNRSR